MFELVQKAGPVAYPLGLFSVIALAIILERVVTLSKLKRIEDAAFAELAKLIAGGNDSPSLQGELAEAPVAHILNTITELKGATEESQQTLAEIGVSVERMRLRRYLGLLATIGSVSPFIGLFGTVLGVLESFQKMQTKGLGGQEMAGGIGEALSATAIGLAVAIPSVMAYNFFTGRVQGMVLEIHSHIARLIPALDRNEAMRQSGKSKSKEA